MKTNSCTKCGARELEPTTFSASRKVAGHTFQGEIAASKCNACGETLVDGPALEAFDVSAALELARAGFAAPEAMRFMRSALGLRAVELAELLDLTPETISRVENAKMPPDKRSVALLAAMLEDKAVGVTRTIDQLRAIARPHKLKGTVRLNAASERTKGAARRVRG